MACFDLGGVEVVKHRVAVWVLCETVDEDDLFGTDVLGELPRGRQPARMIANDHRCASPGKIYFIC